MTTEDPYMQDARDESAPLFSVEPGGVARRALILAAAVCRGSIDSGAGQPDAESLRNRILEWLTTLGLWSAVEPGEEKLLRAPLGTLAVKDVIRSTWYAEGLAVLSWALDRLALPQHDVKSDSYALTDSVCFLRQDAADVVDRARLRTPAELGAYRELVYAVHCQLRQAARDKGRMEFTNSLDMTWLATLRLDPAHLIINHELAIDQTPLSNVDDDRLAECTWITCERHRAIIWLMGQYPAYSRTPVDT